MQTREKIGLIGGLGWPATVAYYDAICGNWRARGRAGTPEMTIESLDMSRTLAARGAPDDPASWQAYDDLFIEAFQRLEMTGCSAAALASVTPHNRLNSILSRVSIPVIGVVDAVADCLDHGAGDVIVLGTSVTMLGNLFDAALSERGRNVVKADPGLIAEVSTLLEEFFYSGRAQQGRTAMLHLLEPLSERHDNLTVLLACTDFAPAFPEAGGAIRFSAGGVEMLDTTAAHVDAILGVIDAERENPSSGSGPETGHSEATGKRAH